MRLGGTKATAIHQYRGLGNQLYDLAGSRPSLDLRFAENKSLVDSVSGQNLITFTRASTGTYVDSDGVIRSAATNLLLQSQNFSTTWTNFASSEELSATPSPAGDLTAFKIVEDGTTGAHYITQVVSALTGVHTCTCFMKAAGRTNAIMLFAGGTTQRAVGFNLTTGATYAEAIGGVSPPDLTADTVSLGNGWFRCRMSWTADGQTTLRIYTDSGTGTGSTIGDGSSGILLWGAQLEVGSTATTYIPTGATINSAPRFDHNPLTGECLGLLVEEQRTNLIIQSQELTASTGASVALNAATSPLGTLTAVVVTEDDTNGNHAAQTQAASVSAVATTCSFYGKPNGRSWVSLRLGGINRAWFNLSTGQVGTTAAGTTATSIQAFPNGFYRCSCTFTPAAGAANIFFRMGTADATDSYTGDGTSGVILFGFQIEVGAFPTSYIPTTTAAATRTADVASISGSNYSSWARQDEGSFFAEWDAAAFVARPLSVNDGTGNNANGLVGTSGSIAQNIYVGNSFQGSLGVNGTYSLNVFYRQAGAYRANDSQDAVNGTLSAVDTACSVPTTSQLLIGQGRSGASLPHTGHLRRIAFFPQRLSSNVLQAITQ